MAEDISALWLTAHWLWHPHDLSDLFGDEKLQFHEGMDYLFEQSTARLHFIADMVVCMTLDMYMDRMCGSPCPTPSASWMCSRMRCDPCPTPSANWRCSRSPCQTMDVRRWDVLQALPDSSGQLQAQKESLPYSFGQLEAQQAMP